MDNLNECVAFITNGGLTSSIFDNEISKTNYENITFGTIKKFNLLGMKWFTCILFIFYRRKTHGKCIGISSSFVNKSYDTNQSGTDVFGDHLNKCIKPNTSEDDDCPRNRKRYGWTPTTDNNHRVPGANNEYGYSELDRRGSKQIANEHMYPCSQKESEQEPTSCGRGEYGTTDDVYNHIGQPDNVQLECEYSHLSVQSDYDHLGGQ